MPMTEIDLDLYFFLFFLCFRFLSCLLFIFGCSAIFIDPFDYVTFSFRAISFFFFSYVFYFFCFYGFWLVFFFFFTFFGRRQWRLRRLIVRHRVSKTRRAQSLIPIAVNSHRPEFCVTAPASKIDNRA